MLPYILCYNIGRISSYVLAGAFVGMLGGQALRALSLDNARLIGQLIAGGFLVALGLYVAGWSRALGSLEKLGAHAWRRIEPIGRRYLPVKHATQAFAVGLLWGWLPCGLVYAALAWSLVAGDAATGAAFMLVFGLGTLPMLLAMGAAAKWLTTLTRHLAFRRSVAAVLVLVGVYTMISPHWYEPHGPMTTSQEKVTAAAFGHLPLLKQRK
jgi:sulfite exporter TauE/SafE